MISHEDVRRIALRLPGSYEQASFGAGRRGEPRPGCSRGIRDDPEALVMWVESVEDKDALIAAEPGTFFTTPHYDGQPIVLVNLEAVDDDEAVELITESWRLRAPRSLVKAWDDEHG
jgi:hypothetical protein